MWGALLQEENLFNQGNLLKFLPLMKFETESGFDDSDWRKREDEEKQMTMEDAEVQDMEQGDLDL
jgi:hypothetical protein